MVEMLGEETQATPWQYDKVSKQALPRCCDRSDHASLVSVLQVVFPEHD
jgi:hypothetical protein